MKKEAAPRVAKKRVAVDSGTSALPQVPTFTEAGPTGSSADIRQAILAPGRAEESGPGQVRHAQQERQYQDGELIISALGLRKFQSFSAG